MKHSIRQRVLDPVTGLMVTKIETVNGELGSGILDKNGKEIFEGDIVKCGCKKYQVEYERGALKIEKQPISLWADHKLEIVGHVDD